MIASYCAREKELMEALQLGHWPVAANDSLRTHVATCARCADAVLVHQALQAERVQQMMSPKLQAPGILWWRAQLRRRNEAMEQLARPMWGAQVFAVALLVCAVVGFLVEEAMSGGRWIAALHHTSQTAAASDSSAPGWAFLLTALGCGVLLVGGVVAYLRLDRQ